MKEESDTRTKEVLSRIEKYLSLMRYKYTEEEKLQRIHVLQEFYKGLDSVSSVEVCKLNNIQVAEQLSGKLTLPLKVRGVFLTEGRHKRKYYTAAELEKSASIDVNQRFPLMLDHKDKEAGKIIGIVSRIEYDESISGLRWWGHINDETFARNVIDGIITDVSATIYSNEEWSDQYGLVGTNLTYSELSLVMDGAAVGNKIEVDK